MTFSESYTKSIGDLNINSLMQEISNEVKESLEKNKGKCSVFYDTEDALFEMYNNPQLPMVI